jgi:hypothetical protein
MEHNRFMPRKSSSLKVRTRPNGYRTTRDIVIPKGTKIVVVTSMKQHIVHAAMAVIAVGKHAHFDWLMYVEDALKEGLIEEIPQTLEGPGAFADYPDSAAK